MPLFRIRLREDTTIRASSEFEIETETAEGAAATLLAAYHRARALGTNVVQLPDGQRELLERDHTLAVQVSCAALDPEGNETHVLVPDGKAVPDASGDPSAD